MICTVKTIILLKVKNVRSYDEFIAVVVWYEICF